MKKEEIVALGVDEEIAQKIVDMASAEINGVYVTKERFNELNEAKKNAEALLKERDGQLETLKKSAGDSAELQKQIEELQKANKATAAEYEGKIKQMQIDNAVDKAITGANGKNVKAIKALLNLEKAELSEDGTVKGLSEQLEALAKAEDSSFLFGTGVPAVKGMVPGAGAGAGASGQGVDFSKMSYSQISEYLEANPDAQIQ